METQGFRFANSTRKNYISHIRTWLFFCFYFSIIAIPASEQSLCLFMELMSITVGYDHCKNILGGIKYLHGALNLSFPHNSFSLDTTMQGLKRKLARTPFQVLPMNPTVLKLMYRGINLNKIEDVALWSSFLIAFFCLFRKANVVPENSRSDFTKIITRNDIEIDEENRKVYVYVGFSKTNQYRKFDHCIPIPENTDPCLDLFRHIKKLFDLVDAPPEAPAFSFSRTNFINYKSFTTRMKALLRYAGLNPDLYSGHSFRRGGASFLFSSGATQLMVQILGNWSSMVYTRYLYLSEEDRMEAQGLMMAAINSMV